MRTLIKALLAASMLMPVAAQAQEVGGDRGGRPERQRPPGDRPGGPGEPRGPGGPGVGPGNIQGARPDFRSERPWDDRRGAGRADRGGPDRNVGGPGADGRPDARPDWRNRPDAGVARPDRGPDRPDRPRDDWRGDRGQPGPGRPGFDGPRPDRGADRADWRARRPGWDRPGPNQPPLASGRPGWRGGSWNPQPGWDRARPGDGGTWNRGWRDDRRYDWGRYRAANRGAYRLPQYYAPSGWRYGYRRFSVGTTLWTGLWGSNYWIDDPFDYRLPEAYGPYRWVRYYDDALLVDVRNGRVVDVVYDIFF